MLEQICSQPRRHAARKTFNVQRAVMRIINTSFSHIKRHVSSKWGQTTKAHSSDSTVSNICARSEEKNKATVPKPAMCIFEGRRAEVMTFVFCSNVIRSARRHKFRLV